MGCMPTAPPQIHLSLPQMCGSGKNGASPMVRHAKSTNFQSLMICNMFLILRSHKNIALPALKG